MKLGCFSALLFCTALLLSGCGAREPQEPVETTPPQTAAFTRESKIKDVKNAPMFSSYGRLLFPVEDSIAASSAAVRAQRVRRRPRLMFLLHLKSQIHLQNTQNITPDFAHTPQLHPCLRWKQPHFCWMGHQEVNHALPRPSPRR